MSQPTIMMFTTYPLKRSIHGGQRRSLALLNAYKEAGYKAVSVAIFNSPSYPRTDEKGKYDIASPELTIKEIQKVPLFEDIVLGRMAYEDPDIRLHIIKQLKFFKPKYITIEQAYLYSGLRRIIEEIGISVEIINSSQNIEYKMKADIYAQHSNSLNPKSSKEAIKTIKKLEEDIAKDAIITIAVSKSDAEVQVKLGAKNVMIVPNGIEKGVATERSLKRWREYFHQRGIDYPILFTGSAHPPNWAGFLHMIGDRLGFLPINAQILVVGDVGPALEYVISGSDAQYGSSFWLRAYKCGRLSDEDLTGLIHLSKVIVLPITEGGGSNLKTAEAIVSGKKVLTTSHAMRGYEEYSGYKNIYVEDSPDRFKQKLAELLLEEEVDLSEDEEVHIKNVLWVARTKKLVEYMRKNNV